MKLPGGGYIKRLTDNLMVIIIKHENYDGYEVRIDDRVNNVNYEIGYTKTINQAKKLGNSYLLVRDVKKGGY